MRTISQSILEEGDNITIQVWVPDEARLGVELLDPDGWPTWYSGATRFGRATFWGRATETGVHYVHLNRYILGEPQISYRLSSDAPWHYIPGGGGTTTTTKPPTTTTTLPTSQSFYDVPPGHTYYGAIENMAAGHIVEGRGDGTFGPADPVWRQQFAKT